jgi:hypothetical protein
MNMRLCLQASLAHSVTGDTILWNAVPEYITDGLKVRLQGASFELQDVDIKLPSLFSWPTSLSLPARVY